MNFDLPMLASCFSKMTCYELNNVCNYIISSQAIYFQTYRQFSVTPLNEMFDISHIDLYSLCPAKYISLKCYNGRIGCERLQDLPIAPGSILNEQQKDKIFNYWKNDLELTENLFKKLGPQIQLRRKMSNDFNLDVMSRSDSNIAEDYMKSRLCLSGTPIVSRDTTYDYNTPDFIKTSCKQIFENITFKLNNAGNITLPDTIKRSDMTYKRGPKKYQLGLGGIHSTEKKEAFICKDNEIIINADVSSYYPSIIINCGLCPSHIGNNFLAVYKHLVDERLKAKEKGDKARNDSLKIVINGCYGKFTNVYSVLYDPKVALQVAVTGQLALIDLIDMFEPDEVISANTDGVFLKVKTSKIAETQRKLKRWESDTGFYLDTDEYQAVYSRDVNNYVAIRHDKSYKTKGVCSFAMSLSKSPQAPIVQESVVMFLSKGYNIEKTIRNCKDIIKFCHLRNVKNGAKYKNMYLGKTVRWCYVKNGDYILTVDKEDKVAKANGCLPVMTNKGMVKNIDYERYISDAYELLSDLGYYRDLL